jgi:hypothetical protein
MALPFLTFIAQEALFQLVNKVQLANTVTRDYEKYVAVKGQNVVVILPETPGTQDAGAAFASTASTPSTVTVTLDQWKETGAIKMDAKSSSMSQLQLSDAYSAPIANALANLVDQSIATVINGFTQSVGVNATAPTGIDGLGATLKGKFDTLLTIPDADRFVVLGPAAEIEFWKTFGPYQIGGDQNAMISGQLGTKFGMTYLGSPKVTGTNIGGACYHKSAIALACRPLQVSPVAVAGTQVTVDYNGISLTLEYWHSAENSADYIRGQMLYGVTKVLDTRGFIVKK